MAESVDLEKALSAALGNVVSKRIAGLQQELLSELVTTLGGAVGGETATSGALNAAFQRISGAHSQTEMLQSLLESTTPFSNRAALLVVKGERLTGWRSRGFEGASSDGLREIDLPAEGETGWKLVVTDQAATPDTIEEIPESLARAFFDLLGTPSDNRAYLLPVHVKRRPVAALYADSGSVSRSLDLMALDLLARMTGMCLELSVGRARPAAAAVGAPAAEAAPLAREPAEAPAEQQVEAEPVVAPPPEPAPPPAAPAAGRVGPDYDSIPKDDHPIHKKAFRFAKLLVDDLVLYNKDKIEQARSQRDIYGVVRDEIDKSRAAYEKKYAKTSAGKVDYFHQELLRRIAGEDPGVLGSEYPGPLV